MKPSYSLSQLLLTLAILATGLLACGYKRELTLRDSAPSGSALISERGHLEIAAGETLEFDGPRFLGDLVVKAGGGKIVFTQDTHFEGTIIAHGHRQEESSTPSPSEADTLIIIAQKKLSFGPNFHLEAAINVRIGDKDEKVVVPSNAEIDRRAQTAADGGNNSIATSLSSSNTELSDNTKLIYTGINTSDKGLELGESPTDVDDAKIILSGRMIFLAPLWPQRRPVLYLNVEGNVAMHELKISGAPGSSLPDKFGGSSCTGANGGNAMTIAMEVFGTLQLSTVSISLGSGGDGQGCTASGLADVVAKGGRGGQSGLLKLQSSETMTIGDDVEIYTGVGGGGGSATAEQQGEPPIDEVLECDGTGLTTVEARGGSAGAIPELLVVTGSVATDTLNFLTLVGRKGGNAIIRSLKPAKLLAVAGDGGNSEILAPMLASAPPGLGGPGGLVASESPCSAVAVLIPGLGGDGSISNGALGTVSSEPPAAGQ